MATSNYLSSLHAESLGGEYDNLELMAEIDSVIRGVERSLDRLNSARGSSTLNNLLLSMTMSGLGLAFILETGKDTFWLASRPSFIVIATVVYLSLAFYSFDLFRARREVSRRARIVKLQIDLAERTLMNLKSWADRSEMSFRLRRALELRSGYLEALLMEAKISHENGKFWY